MTKKCEACRKQPVAYYVDSWSENQPPRKLCCACVDIILSWLEQFIKVNLNIREIPEDDLEELKDKLHRIKTWVNAYPLDIFPEPDFKKAHKILSQHGMSLDAISASNMRHVLKGIKNIIEEAE